jgi:isocitrate/isopropylmalate dehydrogenase
MGGEGVGPELVAHGLRVLESCAGLYQFDFDLVEYPERSSHYERTGELLTEDGLKRFRAMDAIFFGAWGDPLPPGRGTSLVVRLCQALDLGVGVRPATLYAGRLSPLAGRSDGDIDMVIVRDTTEDCFAVPGGLVAAETPDEVAIGLLVYTRRAVERTIRYAFALAQTRRQRVTLITQSNSLLSHTIWPRVLHEVGVEFPEITTEEIYPDTGAMRFVTRPEDYDVIVTTFWLGGTLTNIMGAVVGGIGVCADGRVNPGGGVGMFQSAHGAAQKYEGLDRVSPIATIRALAMLLGHIGEPDAQTGVELAIARAVGTGRIPDVTTRSPVGTAEATDIIIDELGKSEAAIPR